jgi:hypothetical protein
MEAIAGQHSAWAAAKAQDYYRLSLDDEFNTVPVKIVVNATVEEMCQIGALHNTNTSTRMNVTVSDKLRFARKVYEDPGNYNTTKETWMLKIVDIWHPKTDEEEKVCT